MPKISTRRASKSCRPIQKSPSVQKVKWSSLSPEFRPRLREIALANHNRRISQPPLQRGVRPVFLLPFFQPQHHNVAFAFSSTQPEIFSDYLVFLHTSLRIKPASFAMSALLSSGMSIAIPELREVTES